MEFVALLRALWSRPLQVALGAVVAIGVGFLAAQGTSAPLGVASTRVVLDTVNSQLVEAKPVGADSLGRRAALLADLTGTDAGRPRIARAMRLPEHDVVIVASYLNAPARNTPLSSHAADAAAVTTEPYVVALRAIGPLPIIAIDVSAPTEARAKRLAEATVVALRQVASAHPDTPELLGFVVDSVGPVRANEIVSGGRRLTAAAAALVVFAIWCCGVLLIVRLRAPRTRVRASGQSRSDSAHPGVARLSRP